MKIGLITCTSENNRGLVMIVSTYTFKLDIVIYRKISRCIHT